VNFRAAPPEAGADRGKLGNGAGRRHHAREPGVLSIKPFRRLWIALSLSSLGDWLSIVALTALAPSLASGGAVAKGSAVGGVWLATLLPALLFGPLAGALADRMDRRTMMIVGDVIRGLLFVSIPIFPNLTWIYVAKFLAGIATQFWAPATSASIPNLVPKDKLERANQLSILSTYGAAPLAAGVFSVLALVSDGISRVTPLFHASNVDLALYFNAATYFISALTVYFIREIPKRDDSEKISAPSTAKSIWEGWRFISQTPVVRGLVIGMVGAFAAAGVVIGLGYFYVTFTLHGGSAGWGLVFAAIFFFMPDVELRGQVEKRQRDFRHAIGAFLDLVAMNLSGGRGVPEALMAASEIGDGWAFWRIRDALANARITGQTPWQALGVLGEEVQVNELKDLSAALSLVAEDGAKVRESLTARAVSLRRRELADLEGQAGEKSQSMLLAQMLLAAAFLVFLMYPAVHLLLQA